MDKVKVNALALEFHPVSGNHPMMNEYEYKGLVSDIRLNGQLEPIKLYRGKVVDGRHRTKAVIEIGGEFIDAINIPNNTTIKELREIVLSTEKRRHQSGSQRACAAYLEILEGGVDVSLADQAEKYGVNAAYLSMCKHIAEVMGIKVLRAFVINKTLNLLVNGRYTNYSGVSRLYHDLKRKIEVSANIRPLEDLKINYKKIECRARSVIDELSNEEQEYFLNAFISFRMPSND